MDEQAQRVRRRLTAFVDPRDVADAEGITLAELDALCSIEFGAPLDEAARRFAADGRAQIHEAQVAAAIEGSNQMLTLLGERYLGQGGKATAQDAEVTPLASVLSLYDGKADRKPAATR